MKFSASSLKKLLKRSDTLVLLVRTARSIKNSYDLEYRKIIMEQEHIQLEQKRSEFICNYLRSHITRKLQIGADKNILDGLVKYRLETFFRISLLYGCIGTIPF